MSLKNYPALKSLSQNFLKSPLLAQKLVDRLPLTTADCVVELGAGQGALTFLLSQKAKKVLAVEIDAGHSLRLKERIQQAGQTNIEVLHQDILKADWQEWFGILKEPFYIVGNLPYHISTPILFKVIEHKRLLRAAYVMLQREVADRLLGQPGQKAYGVITILIGYYARVFTLMHLGPNAFFPRPKVASTFVGILIDSDRFPKIEEEDLFQWVVRAAFQQRRKQLKNALVADGRLDPKIILKALSQNGIDPKNRGERLSISQFVALSNSLAGLTDRTVPLPHEP